MTDLWPAYLQIADRGWATGVLGSTVAGGVRAEARLLSCAMHYAPQPLQVLPRPRGSLAGLAAIPCPPACLGDDQARSCSVRSNKA